MENDQLPPPFQPELGNPRDLIRERLRHYQLYRLGNNRNNWRDGRDGPPIRRIEYPRGHNPELPRVKRIKVEEDILSYSGCAGDEAGVYIAAKSIDHYNRYIEIEILDMGDLGQITIGLVSQFYPLDLQVGAQHLSAGYLAESGNFCVNGGRDPMDMHRGPACEAGDRMGVGLRPVNPSNRRDARVEVFFTKNGQELKSYELPFISYNTYPAISMQSEGEEVRLFLDAEWRGDEGMQMLVDGGEDDWVRLDDIRLNGMTLEYTGRGRSIMDVGLAQAKNPLNTTNHYFEFEIVDPGDKCYVAIGLAKKNYPVGRHPGWNHNSIAYHADDGKLFHGSGMGIRFGPKCSMGDIMGCGILFPPDYDSLADDFPNSDKDRIVDIELERDCWDLAAGDFDFGDDDEDDEDGDWELRGGDKDTDSDDDDDEHKGARQRRRARDKPGTAVTVFFTRNGKLVGLRDANIPKGGFYPTIGMLSCNEKVRVDLRPLTG